MFDSIPEQGEAKRLLAAALADGPAHAYLFNGPAGVGKRATALAFAAELLAGDPRVERRTHPDLYVLEPLGDQIRIDAVREMRRDLHMRPFEADRRVYLLFGAHLLNDEAADALLKDLEEPPAYAVIVLVADEVGSLAETIRSRCQAIPFRRLSERAVREEVQARAPQLSEDEATSIARVAGGRLDRAERLLDPAAAQRREELLEVARSVYADPDFDPGAAAEKLLEAARARAAEAKEREEAALEELDLTAREAEQRVRRAGRGASARSCSRRWRSSLPGTATSLPRRPEPRAPSSTRTGRSSSPRTDRWSDSRAPPARPSSSATPGATSRSSSSRPAWRSRPCSSSCGAPSAASRSFAR